GSDAARISDSRSCFRSDGDAGESGQDPAPHRRHGDRRGEGPRRQEHPGTVSVITGLDHLVVLLGDIEAGASTYELLLGRAPSWRGRSDGAQTVLFTLDNMSLELMAPAGERPRSAAISVAPIVGLDHVVVSTGDVERAAALYGARLGLDMALDRSHQDWGHLMFFRCGDLIVEVVRRRDAPAEQTHDQLWGLSWRVADIDATRERLVGA